MMKKRILMFGLFVLIVSSLSAQEEGFRIQGTIRFDSKGPIHVRLITEKEFMKKDEFVESLIFNTEKLGISEVEFSFENIPAGVYAIIAFQDKNNNGRLDHILGLYPSEPFGFSWKAKAKMIPRFKDISFDVNKDTRDLDIDTAR